MAYSYDVYGQGSSFGKEKVGNKGIVEGLHSIRIYAMDTVPLDDETTGKTIDVDFRTLFSGVSSTDVVMGLEGEWDTVGDILPLDDKFITIAGGSESKENALFSQQFMRKNGYMNFEIESRVFTEGHQAKGKGNIYFIETYDYINKLAFFASKQMTDDYAGNFIDQVVKFYSAQVNGVAKSVVAGFNAFVDSFTADAKGIDQLTKTAGDTIKAVLETYWNTLLKSYNKRLVTLSYYTASGKGMFNFKNLVIKNVSYTLSKDLVLLSEKNGRFTTAPRYVDYKISLQTSGHVGFEYLQESMRSGGLSGYIPSANQELDPTTQELTFTHSVMSATEDAVKVKSANENVTIENVDTNTNITSDTGVA